MTWTKPDTSYWNEKFAAWWHDPIDKALAIPGHETRAADYLQIFGFEKPNETFWKLADGIAAGFERGQVPTYHQDERENGAIDYVTHPLMTHPTSGGEGVLAISPPLPTIDVVFPAVQEFLRMTIGTKASHGDYAGQFRGEEAESRFALARFLYTHFVLRFALAEANVGGLGALWHRLPADTRFPDHSIWQHNALCSALYSCMGPSEKTDDVGLLVFSLTPVQGFISRARKLRDFWTGSVLLSWLAFSGLKWIMENLGADHVLYPSLVDQPLVNAWLEREWYIAGKFQPRIWSDQPRDIASLPNKGLILVPLSKATDIATELESAVQDAWQELMDMTLDALSERLNLGEAEVDYLDRLFARQGGHFWQYHWAAVRLVAISDKEELSQLLHNEASDGQFAFIENFSSIISEKRYSPEETSRGILYSTSHALVQSALAAEKMRRHNERLEEPGEKCQLCGEFEVLHTVPWREGQSAKDYSDHVGTFWGKMKEKRGNVVDFKENERLCAICTMKRFLPQLVKRGRHPLVSVLGVGESFPSTTEMALDDYFEREKIMDAEQRRKIAQQLFDNEEAVKGEKIRNVDKYYAILIMDGDRMGKLINGESIASTWKSIMHPHIVARLMSPQFNAMYREAWNKVFNDNENNKLRKRLVTPAIHAAISEALGDFSLYGVPAIITKHRGRLVYAGGDDVCAFLPIQTALKAAQEISDYYTSRYRFIDLKRESLLIEGTWAPKPGKLSINLGKGQDISISAAILICHHKEPLAQMIARSHALLEREAKGKMERNAWALELKKRSGGSRIIAGKWDDHVTWQAFENLITRTSGGKEREIAHALLYRLESMRPGIEAIMQSGEGAETRLINFLTQQIERSGVETKGEVTEIARDILQVIWDRKDAKAPFKPDGLMIAAFLAGGGDKHGVV